MKKLLIGLLFTISMGSLAMDKTKYKPYESDGILNPFAQEGYSFLKRAAGSAIGKKGTLYWPPSHNKNYHNKKHTIEFLALMLLQNMKRNCEIRTITIGGTIGLRGKKYKQFYTEFKAKDNQECKKALDDMNEFIESCDRVK